MEFFNKKEEVLDIVLTEYGRYLLSKGLFKPKFYAFLDKEILYDPECAGYTQTQNEIDRRIKYETPAEKPQRYTVGAETRVNRFMADTAASFAPAGDGFDNSVDYIDAFRLAPLFEDKFFLSQRPLGTTSLTSEWAPAWQLRPVTNQISSSQPVIAINLTSSTVTPIDDGVVQPIPQINITVDYEIFFAVHNSEYTGKKFIPLTPILNDQGVRLYIKDDYFILDVMEENTDYLKENFDIEVFKSWLAFEIPLSPLDFLAPGQLTAIAPKKNVDVEYYLNILVDEEIPPEVAGMHGITKQTITGQPDISRQARLALNRDLYGDTDPDEGCGT